MKIYVKLKYNSGFKIDTKFNTPNTSLTKSNLSKLNNSRFFKNKTPNSKALLYNILLSYSTLGVNSSYNSDSLNLRISKPKVFINKSNKSVYTVLRAPYRYKKGRYQIGRQLYKAIVSFYILIEDGKSVSAFNDLVQVTKSVNLLNNYLNSFSTNLSTMSSLSVTIPFNSPKVFKIQEYKL